MQSLYTIEQIRTLEQRAINDYHIAENTLMERAGEAAFAFLKHYWPNARKISVICGKGNNGGDGFIVARLAHELGFNVKIFTLFPLDQLSGAARVAADQCIKAQIPHEIFSEQSDFSADVIIDAILGIGFRGELKSEIACVINTINQAKLPVLAIDVPSGLDADNGIISTCAIHATATITFIGLKQGLFTGQAFDVCGRIICADLNLPEKIYADIFPSAQLITFNDFSNEFPRRLRSAHKGHFGHVLIIGGDYGMSGAVRLSAEAALRCGAGLVSVATRPEHASAVISGRPEIMCHGITDISQLVFLLSRISVIVIGPGLGQSEWSQHLFACALNTHLPLVVDADALNLLAKFPSARGKWILTPHPGEAARLLATTTSSIQADRFTAINQLQQRYRGSIILKGSGSLILDGDHKLAVCAGGNPGMASGGMGDTLSGIIGSLLAQHFSLEKAAKCGVCLHAKAADEAARYGERGMLASDVIDELRGLINL